MIKYRHVAEQFICRINAGQLAVGLKLPPLRKLMTQHDISMTTALSCYRYLEQQGYASAQDKKGFYANKPYHASNTLTFPRFSPEIKTLKSEPNKIGMTTIANSFATASLDNQLIDSQCLKQSLTSATKHSLFDLAYEPPQGNINLRQQLAKHFTLQGFTSHADELVITNGCLDAVVTALNTFCKAGDVVAVSSPCYVGILEILSLLELAVIEIPTTHEGINLTQLTDIIENNKIKACIFTANHQNPTGHNINNQQKQQLASIAAQYQLPIIEDDIFRELNHRGEIPLPIKHFDEQGWVLWCSSFSKTVAPGLRLGWCKPGRFISEYIQQRQVKTLGVNQPIQLAMAEYIAKGHYARHLKKTNKLLSNHCITYLTYLRQYLPADSEMIMPNGGLVLWVRVPKLDSAKLMLALHQFSIYIKSGHEFSTTALYNDCFRLNIGLIPSESSLKQLDKVIELIMLQSSTNT
ncbi:aminotransferase-like domain-containing protein [Shewanella donghaensis]|uniref:aminotransferase-like domain-containing protein n=1 Tax=Shewanella donghaensis TaxID=238836 RepID=UPI00118253FA|nr:PLP-dependent aminotransferase family protein [Shewanella donghaensis]